jgi:hypothetical protein
MKPYLKKNPSQQRAQGVGPVLKPLSLKKKKKKPGLDSSKQSQPVLFPSATLWKVEVSGVWVVVKIEGCHVPFRT